MLNRIKNMDLDYGLIFSTVYLLKCLIVSISIADAILFLGLLAYMGYNKYLAFRSPKITLDDQMRADILEVREALSKLNVGQMNKPTKPIIKF